MGTDGEIPFSSDAPSLTDDQVKEFERIYRELVDDVFRYAFSCVGRREIAEEITGDTFLALYRNLPGIESEWIRPWLFRVARNQAVTYWRRRSLEQKYTQQLGTVQTTPELEPSVLESKDLKPSHRACLVLRYVHGMDREEIARVTGMTANQVKSALQYGLELLRKRMTSTRSKGASP